MACSKEDGVFYIRKQNVGAQMLVIIMACITLHNICISKNDPCNPRWKLELHLVRKRTKRTKDVRLAQEIRQ